MGRKENLDTDLVSVWLENVFNCHRGESRRNDVAISLIVFFSIMGLLRLHRFYRGLSSTMKKKDNAYPPGFRIKYGMTAKEICKVTLEGVLPPINTLILS
jgi:hypothetical protein